MDKKHDFLLGMILIAAISFLVLYNYVAPLFRSTPPPVIPTNSKTIEKVTYSETMWRQKLSPMQYEVMRRGTTEAAFSGTYVSFNKPGVYSCAGCGQILFSSKNKYDAKTGWASFTKPIDTNYILLTENFGTMTRSLSVLCRRCGSHLGTLFYDGPEPQKERYSMNSIALYFTPDAEIK
jgi:peptide-methionine (R)-S-oxide reductase